MVHCKSSRNCEKNFYEIKVAIIFISPVKTISLLQDVLIDVQYTISSVFD
jgi:hypothetical protein